MKGRKPIKKGIFMKKIAIVSLFVLAVFTMAGALVISHSSKVLAEETDTENAVADNCSCGHAKIGQRGNGPMLEEKAALLGLSGDELQTKLDSGMTFIEIAEEQGITLTQIQEKLMAEKEEWLQSRVDSGFLTQEQADQMKQNMEEKMEEGMIPGFGPGMGMGGKMRHGGIMF